MPPSILGLDIGGANLKAATADRRAASVPFALWKQPDRLPAALADLVARFPDAEELAVTMTGELCDCFETKREGVNAILNAVLNVSRSRLVRVWTTDGAFVDTEEARRHHLKVASANWHALATFTGRFVPKGPAVLVDVGSTTTDIIPILDGKPVPKGLTDPDRLQAKELLYTGVRRTPLCAILGESVAAELFATTLDVYLTLGMIPEDSTDRDTADGRPATKAHARARLARMHCGDIDTISEGTTRSIAQSVYERQVSSIRDALREADSRLFDLTVDPSYVPDDPVVRGVWEAAPDRHRREVLRIAMLAEDRIRRAACIVAGSGEFLARQATMHGLALGGVSLNDELGPEASACAPAYAVAVLAAERR